MAKLKRCTLADPNSSAVYSFRLNPETAEVDSPFRVNIVHTADGWYCDAFGPAVNSLVIAGTTGMGGVEEYEKLRSLVFNWQNRVRSGARVRPLEFHNWESDDHYEVVARSLRKRRAATQPLMVRYELTLAVLSTIDVIGKSIAAAPALPPVAQLPSEEANA